MNANNANNNFVFCNAGEHTEDIHPKKSAFHVINNGANVESEIKTDNVDNEWQNTDVIEWKTTQVQAWMKTLGPRIADQSSNFANITGAGLLLFKCKEELAELMPDEPRTTSKIFFRKISKLRAERNIDERMVQAIKCKKNPGIIGLGNLGNTCFMNSSIQVLLQTPRLIPYLRNYALSNNKDTGSMLSAVSQLVLHARNNKSKNDVYPHAIHHALQRTNRQLCDGGQHDSFECLSSILLALDKDIHEYILRNNYSQQMPEKPKLILEKRNVSFANDAQEKMFLEQMFKKFNPYQSAVRSAMNGILRKVRSCYSCGQSSVTYVTFGSLVLPIVKQKFVSITVDVWGINKHNNHKTIRNLFLPTLWTIKVDILPSDCSTVVKARIFGRLREQMLIAADVSFNANEMRIGNICIGNNNNNIDMDNNNNNNNNNNNSSKEWVQYYDNDGQYCNLSAMQYPFAVMSPSEEQKSDAELCNVMQFAVAVDLITNKFVYKYHQLLSFVNGKVYTGDELLFAVGCSVRNSMNLKKIMMNGEFVQDSEKYTMDANRVRWFVAVLAAEPKINKHENPIITLWRNITISNAKTLVVSISTSIGCGPVSAATVLAQKLFGDDIQKRIISDLRSTKLPFSSYSRNTTSPESMNTIGCCLEEYFAKHVKLLPSVCNCSSNVFWCSTGIAYAPTNLFIKLERSVEEHQKNETKVEYSGTKSLEIPMVSSSYSSSSSSSSSSTGAQKYDLYGVCCHVGGRTQYGHYFAHVKSLENGQWYEANDSSVEKEHANRVTTNSAIVLLYTKHE